MINRINHVLCSVMFRTKLMRWVGLAFACFLTSALAGAVSEPVGVMSLTVGPRDTITASMPFIPFGAAPEGLLGDQLPGHDSFSKAARFVWWDRDQPGVIRTAYKSAGGEWLEWPSATPAAFDLQAGHGFELYNPADEGQRALILGRIDVAETVSQFLAPGYNLFGLAYPGVLALSDSLLAAQGAIGGKDAQSADLCLSTLRTEFSYLFKSAQHPLSGSWLLTDMNEPSDLVLEAGAAHYYYSRGKEYLEWAERNSFAGFTKPSRQPVIKAVTVSGGVPALVIDAQGFDWVEVFRRETAPDEALGMYEGWERVASDLRGHDVIVWEDKTFAEQAAGSHVWAYVVAHQLDSNGDGVSDAWTWLVKRAQAQYAGAFETMQAGSASVSSREDTGLEKLAHRSGGETITIDGYFDDWLEEYVIGNDPQGDGWYIDWLKLSAVSQDGYLYLSYETDTTLDENNLWGTYIFIQVNGSGQQGYHGSMRIAPQYLINYRNLHVYEGDGYDWNFPLRTSLNDSAWKLCVSDDPKRVEMRIDENLLGVSDGEYSLEIELYSQDPEWKEDDWAPDGKSGYSFSVDRVLQPLLSPDGGHYLVGQTVTVTSAEFGASLYYTLDGSEPTPSSTQISWGGTLEIHDPTMLRVRAFKAGREPSHIKSALYEFGGVVSAGASHTIAHTIALHPDGSVWTWGPWRERTLGSWGYTGPLDPDAGVGIE